MHAAIIGAYHLEKEIIQFYLFAFFWKMLKPLYDQTANGVAIVILQIGEK